MELFRNPARHAELLDAMYNLPTQPRNRIEPCAYEEMPRALIDAFLVTQNSKYDVYRLPVPTYALIRL